MVASATTWLRPCADGELIETKTSKSYLKLGSYSDVITSLIGASLGAGGAGAGGAAAARPLQRRLHGNVSPPQVRVATATQTQKCLIHEENYKNPISLSSVVCCTYAVCPYLARMR